MKFIFLLLLGISSIHLSIYSQDNNISLNFKNAQLKDVLRSIEKQSGYLFLYSNDDIDAGMSIDFSFSSSDIHVILENLLKPKKIEYTIKNRHVVLSKMVSKPVVSQLTSRGKVVNVHGEPLAGVFVLKKESSGGTVTDSAGIFVINTKKEGEILQFSLIGFRTELRTLNNQSLNEVILSDDISPLEEVVVVGYGVQKKISVVGAISQIKAKDLKKSSVPNLSNALAGRIAGIITIMGSGKPGEDDSKIYIRGLSTTNTSDPLVLVDGLETDWKQLDPEDIESFSVLKDASATAVYGVRGANGVILITTKRGFIGPPQFNISIQTAVQQPIRTPQYLDSYNFAILKNEALRNEGRTEEYTVKDLEHYRTGDSPYTHPNNDYYNDFLKKASLQQMVNANSRGGNDLIKYYISASYLHQEGLYKDFSNKKYLTNTNYDRYNFKSNLDFTITKNLQLSLDLDGRFQKRLQPNFDTDIFDKIRRLPPNWQSYINPNGTIGGKSDETRLSPYALISGYGNRQVYNNVLEGAFKLNYKLDFILEGLDFRTLLGYTSTFTSRRVINEKPELWEYTRFGTYNLNRRRDDVTISLSKGPSTRQFFMESAINYSKSIGDHDISVMILYQRSQSWVDGNIPIGYAGLVSRVNYSLKSRYLFEFNTGYNGSMQFSKKNRYSLFPSFSAGWIVSNEKFWKNSVNFINVLKVRGSYGEVGNDKLGSYKYLYVQQYFYVPNADGYMYYWGENPGLSGERGIYEGIPGNPDLTWERAKKSNLGFDSKMAGNTISFSFDVFYEKRKNILFIPVSVPLVFGLTNPPENLGEVINRGIDLEFMLNNNFKSLNYYLKTNFTFARNHILKIDEEGKKYEWQKAVNRPIGQHFGLTDIGLYSIDDFRKDPGGDLLLENGYPVLKQGIPVPAYGVVYPGDCKYKDLNGDGIIDDYDAGAIGRSAIPEYSYGITLGAERKNFDVSILIQGAGGAQMYFQQDAVWEFYALGKVMERHLDRYNPEDPTTWNNATYPRLHSEYNPNNHQKTTRWLFSRNYLRIKNVEIGYSLGKKVLSKMNISKLRFFVNGTNLFTFDRMMDWDPETNSEQGNQYPQLRSWNLGIYATF